MSAAIHRALAESLCPPLADSAGSDRIRARTANLLASRIAAMAAPMRFALAVLFLLFDLSALATTGRRFVAAPAEARRRHCEAAESWPLVPFKDLLRLARAMALLAHYDDSEIRSRLGFVPGGEPR